MNKYNNIRCINTLHSFSEKSSAYSTSSVEIC